MSTPAREDVYQQACAVGHRPYLYEQQACSSTRQDRPDAKFMFAHTRPQCMFECSRIGFTEAAFAYSVVFGA